MGKAELSWLELPPAPKLKQTNAWFSADLLGKFQHGDLQFGSAYEQLIKSRSAGKSVKRLDLRRLLPALHTAQTPQNNRGRAGIPAAKQPRTASDTEKHRLHFARSVRLISCLGQQDLTLQKVQTPSNPARSWVPPRANPTGRRGPVAAVQCGKPSLLISRGALLSRSMKFV